MGHHRFHPLEAKIGGVLRRRQHAGGIKNVEPLVFHGAHVEVVHGHDHENIEVVLPAIGLLIPAHGPLQRVHGVVHLGDVVGLGVDAQGHLTPRGRHEAILDPLEVPGHEGKEIGRLGEGVFPYHLLAPIGQGLPRYLIAVGQHDRQGRAITADRGAVAREHVGPI